MTNLAWVWWSWNLVYDLRVMLQWEFMRNIFEAGTMIAIVAGIVSYLVVLRRSSFAAHALGHVGFSGAAGAVVFGVNPFYGLLLFTIVSGSGIAALGQKASHRDVEIGTVLAFMLGLGLLFIVAYNGFSTEAYSILFGDIVGISNAQVAFTLETSIPVLVVLGLVYRQLLFASLDEEVAEAKGMHTFLLGLIFMLALAVAVSIAVTVVGVLLIFALTVTPAAIAVRLAKRPLYAVIISVSCALFAVWAGAFIAFYEVEPTSFFIVTIMFTMYIAVRLLPYFAALKNRVAARLSHGRPASALSSVVGEVAPPSRSVPEPAGPAHSDPELT
jgi:zinc/manganese transport system permease protein